MHDIVTFPTSVPHPVRPNPHQPVGWQRTQSASILALHAAEDHLSAIGIPRSQARVIAYAAVRTFLQNLADRTYPVCRVQETVEDFIKVVELAHLANQPKPKGVA